jgi:site-specific DNA-methyltransferase (adenine-specific)
MNIDTEVYRKNESPTFGNTLSGAVPLVSEVYLMDNIELMKHYPDKYFDLAVVDPPYGLGERLTNGGGKRFKKHSRIKKELVAFDNKTPDEEYFDELFRVSKNQIIWGANYFELPPTRCVLIWDKVTYKEFTGSDFELAWTSFDFAAKAFRMSRIQALRNGTIHPTQKPIELYDWIYSKFATEGSKVLDTHLGSGSSRISANKSKLHFVGCEIDEEYFNKQNKRYDEFASQARLW